MARTPRYVRRRREEEEEQRDREELAFKLMIEQSAAYQERKRIMAALWVRLLEDNTLTQHEKGIVKSYIMGIEPLGE